MIAPFGDKRPAIDPTAWVVDSAVVLGDVVLGPEASLWFGAVVRGDVERIRIGARSNVQDNATVHVTGGRWPTLVGAGVTVGHAVVLHGCTIGDDCLVGIGAVVLDGAVVEPECLIGAGALVTPGTRIPARSLVLGSPARRVRALTDEEVAQVRQSAANYVEHARRYRALGVR
ncbi:MAG TPA: gamma carbonic anhydrase family protein [Candidatus Binatia bacterium]|nr:gamma carbonic anhydrase family protein [Candidatus Binatia bacterium]